MMHNAMNGKQNLIGNSFWFGTIPEDWSVERAWKIFAERKDFSADGNESLLSVSEYYGVRPRADVMQVDDFTSRAESLEGYRVCCVGDLVMNYMLAWKGSQGITQYHGIVSPAYAVFTFKGKHSPSFFHYLVRTPEACLEFKRYSSGIIDSRLRLYPEDFLHKIKLPVPPLEQQQAIAAFLDRETAKIDTLIEKQQRLIALLAEKRQAVISHAVTQGLDPKVPMKDSGIEWMGIVPEHWEIKSLGTLTKTLQTGPFGSQLHSSDYVDDATPVINPANIQDGRIVPDWSNTITQEVVGRLQQHVMQAGDLLVGRRGELGRCAVVRNAEQGWMCGTGCIRIILKPSCFPAYISTLFSTSGLRETLLLESVGATMDNLNTAILAHLMFAIPPLPEQQEIITHSSLIL